MLVKHLLYHKYRLITFKIYNDEKIYICYLEIICKYLFLIKKKFILATSMLIYVISNFIYLCALF